MGCYKLTYYPESVPSPFLGIWKKESLEKSTVHKKGDIGEKSDQLVFCNSYTPFGGAFSSYQRVGNQQNKYKYNGKELQDDLDLNLYDYGVRFYDPAIGRFATIDPFANQRDWLTPYNYVQNNPILRVDPDGALDDYYTYGDGTTERVETEGNTDTFYYVDPNNNIANLGTFERNGNGLIQLPASYSVNEGDVSFSFSVKEGQTDRAFVSPEALSSLFGAFAETGFGDFTITQFSYSDGTSPFPSTSHINGRNGDFRYLRTDESGGGGTVFDAQFDQSRNAQFTEALYKFGYQDLKSYNVPIPYQNTGILPRTSHLSGHDNHLHLQGFSPSIRTVNYPSALPGPVQRQLPPINP